MKNNKITQLPDDTIYKANMEYLSRNSLAVKDIQAGFIQLVVMAVGSVTAQYIATKWLQKATDKLIGKM